MTALRLSDPARAASAAQLFVVGAAINLVILVLSRLLTWVAPAASGVSLMLVEELVWLGSSIVTLIGLLMFASAAERKTLPMLTAVVWIISSLFELLSTLLMQLQLRDEGLHVAVPHLVQSLFFDLDALIGLAARGLLFWFFVQVTLGTRSWVLPLLGASFFMSTLRSLLSIAITHADGGYELYRHPAYRYGMMLVGLYGGIAWLVATLAVQRTVKGVSATPATAQAGLVPPPVAEAPVSPALDFVIGGAVLALGVGVTLVSMEAASAGGRYVVATGAIAVGLARIVRGFIRLAKR